MLRYIREGRIKVDKTKNTEPVTFHDSCNNARSCGLFEEPRELLNLVCMDFREMVPNRAENYCCTGGGGAMSMSEYTPRRLKSGSVKAGQLKDTGATTVVTSCHNCVDGLADVIRHYKLGMQVTQLVNLVANALVWEEKEEVPVEKPEEVPAEAAAPEELPLTGRRIVVADDDPDQLVYLGTVLGDAGATIFEAADGDEALELCRKEKPDLLTLDLEMPGTPSHDVFKMLRDELPGLRICIVTGRPELRRLIYDQDTEKPEGYLDKPVTEEDLLRNVRKVLETT